MNAIFLLLTWLIKGSTWETAKLPQLLDRVESIQLRVGVAYNEQSPDKDL